MFDPIEITGNKVVDNQAFLEALASYVFECHTVKESFCVLSNVTSFLKWFLNDINWVGVYLLEDKDSLILGPFQGLPACEKIKVGKGVCGTCIAQNEALLVSDVHSFPGHIACDGASNSELVCPFYKTDGTLIGLIDIDSPLIGRFTNEDLALIKSVCSLLSSAVNPL